MDTCTSVLHSRKYNYVYRIDPNVVARMIAFSAPDCKKFSVCILEMTNFILYIKLKLASFKEYIVKMPKPMPNIQRISFATFRRNNDFSYSFWLCIFSKFIFKIKWILKFYNWHLQILYIHFSWNKNNALCKQSIGIDVFYKFLFSFNGIFIYSVTKCYTIVSTPVCSSIKFHSCLNKMSWHFMHIWQ